MGNTVGKGRVEDLVDTLQAVSGRYAGNVGETTARAWCREGLGSSGGGLALGDDGIGVKIGGNLDIGTMLFGGGTGEELKPAASVEVDLGGGPGQHEGTPEGGDGYAPVVGT